jgi:hypothetical protein
MTVSGWWCSRYWYEMRLHVPGADNRCYAGFEDFSRWLLTFLRERVPRYWYFHCDEVTDNPPTFGFSRAPVYYQAKIGLTL